MTERAARPAGLAVLVAAGVMLVFEVALLAGVLIRVGADPRSEWWRIGLFAALVLAVTVAVPLSVYRASRRRGRPRGAALARSAGVYLVISVPALALGLVASAL